MRSALPGWPSQSLPHSLGRCCTPRAAEGGGFTEEPLDWQRARLFRWQAPFGGGGTNRLPADVARYIERHRGDRIAALRCPALP